MPDRAFNPELVASTMKERKVTQTGMAKVMGLPSQSAFSNILKGKRRVTAEEAKRAYDFLGIRAEPSIQVVPVIGITNAGNWREAIQMPLGNVPVPRGKASDDAFALEISGDSMDLLIEDGGYVVVDPRQKELRDGKCYLIQNHDDEATVKCYRRSPARFEPVSTNPEHKGWLVSEVDFIVLGRIVWKGEPL
jgi:SOS-response transcriptional repressor LexA